MSNQLQEGSSPAIPGFRHRSADELLVAAKQGDHAAYLELCQRASPMAMGMVIKIMKNRDDCEDVLQEAFINAFLHLHSFNEQCSFSTWFVRIAVNAALMLLRKQRRTSKRRHQDQDDEDILQYLVDPSPNPETLFFASESKARLRQAVNQLPATLRHTIELRHAQGASVKEVAASMGISVPAVKSRLQRANMRLRSTLQEHRSPEAASSAIAARQRPVVSQGDQAKAGFGSVIGDRTRTLRLERAAVGPVFVS